jgi:hypothetical protein
MKTSNIKEQNAQEIIRHKNIECTSNQHIKWAKDYLHRSFRRRIKQDIKKEKDNYEQD